MLREVDNADLAVALKGATKEVSKLIFDNISKRLQEMIREDMELMGPVRVREVEESQQRIVNIVRKLEDEGEIIIARGGRMKSMFRIDRSTVEALHESEAKALNKQAAKKLELFKLDEAIAERHAELEALEKRGTR